MTALSTQQQEALDAMRAEFSSRGTQADGLPLNDSTFCRYLRARSFNFEKAKDMLDATIKWREEFGIAEMKGTWKPTIATENATGKMYLRGSDKQGIIRSSGAHTTIVENVISIIAYTAFECCAGHAIIYMKPKVLYHSIAYFKYIVCLMQYLLYCLLSSTRTQKTMVEI